MDIPLVLPMVQVQRLLFRILPQTVSQHRILFGIGHHDQIFQSMIIYNYSIFSIIFVTKYQYSSGFYNSFEFLGNGSCHQIHAEVEKAQNHPGLAK